MPQPEAACPPRKKTRRTIKTLPPTPPPSSSASAPTLAQHEENSNSSSDELVIDIPPCVLASPSKSLPPPVTRSTPKTSPEKRLPSTRKKRRRPSSCSSSSATDDLEDQTIEETIQRCATKNNLTPECVKKLLKKLVLNEHVMAIVKLKEEEEEVQQAQTSSSEPSKDGTEGDDEDDELSSLQPKLTRLKAKQLNKQPLPIVPLKAPITDEEVAVLIQQELASDDDDEEYKPTEEDIHSDDDPSIANSDIDSQPRTPATPATPGQALVESVEPEDGGLYSKDGLFKIPRLRNDSHCSLSEQEQENIALRTRSKLCLQTTAIETIESTFVPPDITTDMYDFDCDMDLVWKDFLSDFTKPLANTADDDDEADPEYIAADKIPIDREELREVKVSKKELNELVSELIEMSGIFDESFLDESLVNSTINPNIVPKDAQNNTQLSDREAILNTPVPTQLDPPIAAAAPADNSLFQPSTVSTPTASTIRTPSVMPVHSAQAIHFTDQPPHNSGQVVQSIPTPVYPSYPNHEPASGQSFVQQPTPQQQSSFQPYCAPPANVAPVPTEKRPSRSSWTERKYNYYNQVVPDPVSFPEGQTGFTDFQLKLFQQQMRMHVQLAAQSFLQCVGNPVLDKLADPFRKMLTDLKDDPSPSTKAWNLEAALKCCESWESELEDDSKENEDYIRFLNADAERCEKSKKLSSRYLGYRQMHSRLMEKIAKCNAFMYPKLLPLAPFRMDLPISNKHRICPEEARLVAFGLELFFPIVKKELNKYRRSSYQKEKVPTTKQVCGYISKFLCKNHTEEQLVAYVRQRQCTGPLLDPIKYYFMHGRALPYQHVLEPIDFDNVLPPASYQRHVLPYMWDRYVYSNEGCAKSGDQSVKAASKSSKKKPPPPAVPPEPNINISISVILDPAQTEPKTPAVADKTSAQEDTFQINPQFLDQSYHPVEVAKPQSQPTLASYLSGFKANSSTGDISAVEQQSPQVNIEPTDCCSCKCHHQGKGSQQEPPNSLLKGQRRLTDYFRVVEPKGQSADTSRKLKEKLWEIYKRFRASFRIYQEKESELFKRIYRHLELLESYSHFLEKLKSMSANHAAKKTEGGGEPSKYEHGSGTCRKLVSVDHVDDKDVNYAYNFFEKVEETLLGENKHVQYEKFLEILQSFNEQEDRVADLYHKIESLLIADHPELCDLFLTFLLPGQAAEVGKFFEHFILTNANDFLSKLNIYFSKQPSQIKKVYSCLNDLSNEPNVKLEQIKTRILPLLKGNPFLIEWFLQLFPQEKPPDSVGGNLADYEAISMKKLPLPDYSDPNQIYEDVPFVEVAPPSSESTGEGTVCGTKYIQGRVMCGTLPARLSFLASDCAAPKEDSTVKGCVHSVRCTPEKTAAEHEVTSSAADESMRDEPARYKLCDDATFKAHAIRLNPLVHGGKGVNYADVAHLLAPDVEGESTSNVEDEKPSSPKKQQPKTAPKKRINSPVNKKPHVGKNSPIASGKKAPISVPADSKVISSSKKLKSIVEALAPEEPVAAEPLPQTPVTAAKRKPTSSPTTPTSGSVKKEKLSKKNSSEELDEQQPPPPVNTDDPGEGTSSGNSEPNWTRDEDKVILEEIKNGYSAVDELVERIGGKIPSRNGAQIRARYEFLMEVLKKFQKSN